MTNGLDPNRLRQLRKLKDLTQDTLAKKARLTKQTIHRIEAGRQRNIRPKTIERLCQALGVEADVLSGKKPLPLHERQPADASDDSRYQLNVRLNGAVKNSFALAALHYQVPVARIVELAPLLFVVAAEQSLKRRREKLDELTRAFDDVEALQSNFLHLPPSIASSDYSQDAFFAEKQSIDDRDIFGTKIPDEIFTLSPVADEYDESEHNPFAVYLKELAAATTGAANLDYFDARSLTSYEVCRDEALALSGGDKELADGILRGWALIHEMPRELLRPEAVAERIAWMRPKIDAARKEYEEFVQALDQMIAKDPKELEKIEKTLRDSCSDTDGAGK